MVTLRSCCVVCCVMSLVTFVADARSQESGNPNATPPAAVPAPSSAPAGGKLNPVVVPAPEKPKGRSVANDRGGAPRAAVHPRRAQTKKPAAGNAANAPTTGTGIASIALMLPNSADFGTASPQSGGMFVPNQSFGPLGTVPAKDIPFSTNSIPQTLIRDQQAHSADEALKNDPSIRAFPQTPGFAQNILIRGFMTNTFYNTFQDGLDLLGYGQPALENNERIDILKGAPAILYGFAPPAGIVNYISKQPLDTNLNEIGGGFISSGTGEEHLDVSRRFKEGFGFRATVYQQDGNLPVDHTSASRAAQSFSADWKNDELRVWTSFQHYDFKQFGGNPAIFWAPQRTSVLPGAPNPSNLFGQPFYNQTGETKMVTTGLDWQRDGWTVSAAAGYAGNNYNAVTEQFPGTTAVAANGNINTVAFANTLDVNSTAQRLVVSKEVWVGYFSNTTSVSFNHSIHNLDTGNGTGITLGPSNIYRPVYFAPPALTVVDTTTINTDLTNTLLYDKFDIGPWVSLIGGGVDAQYQAKTLALIPTTRQLSYLSQQALTPLAAIQIHPVDYVTVYGSYIKSLQPGQIAPATAANAFQVLAPFVGEQEEVGVKADLSAALSVNAALFQIKQASTFLNAQNVLTEQGQQVNRGVEFLVTGKPVHELALYGGATFIDPRVYNNTTFYTGQAPGVSKARVTMFAEYSPDYLRGVTFMGGVYYSSRFLVQENSLALVAAGVAQDVYADQAVTADVGLKYQFVAYNTPMILRGYISNVFNEGYWLVANPSNNGQVIIGQPRRFSLDMTARF